jgi:hypothetical protein
MKTPHGRPRRPALGGWRPALYSVGAGVFVLLSPASGNAATNPPPDSHGCPTDNICGYTGLNEAGQMDAEPDTPGLCRPFKQPEESVDNNTANSVNLYDTRDCSDQPQATVPPHGTATESQMASPQSPHHLGKFEPFGQPPAKLPMAKTLGSLPIKI